MASFKGEWLKGGGQLLVLFWCFLSVGGVSLLRSMVGSGEGQTA